jgi:hypothetical protein
MADLAQVAQSGVDPASGSYLSAEKRKAIFARTRVSSNVFGRGGALVPINKQSDSGALVTTAIQNQTQNISSLQGQINSLRSEVNDFRTALSRITDLIAYDSVLEKNSIKQEQEEQRRATEQGLRIGRESLVERKIQNALIAPAQAIAQRTQSILDKVKQFFTTLFLGWLTNQGINTLRALSEGNGKKLEEIKDNVLKGLGIAAGTLFLLNGGFFAIAATITRLSLKIGGWLIKNTIGRFFGALGNLLKSGGNALVSGAQAGIRALTGAGPKAVPAAAGGATVAAAGGAMDDVAKAAARGGGGLLKNTGNLLKGAASFGSKLFAPINIGIAAYRYSQGDMVGGTLSAASALPVVGLPAVALDIGREFGAFEGTFLGKNENTQKPKAQQPKAQQAKTQPKVDKSKQLDASKPAEFGNINVPAEVSPQAQTTRIPSAAFNLGPAPEAKPNIVYKRTGSSAQQRSGAAPTGGSVNEVPAISASNPDNFYVLYSQVNYNVVT